MKIFLDTSSLFKLYHEENGTKELEQLLSQVKITYIYLSELAKVEFTDAFYTADKLLQTLIEREGLATQMPSHQHWLGKSGTEEVY